MAKRKEYLVIDVEEEDLEETLNEYGESFWEVFQVLVDPSGMEGLGYGPNYKIIFQGEES